MSTCFVHSVEDLIDTGNGINVTYTQQRPGFKPRKTADVQTYRRECPASLNQYDVTMVKILNRNPLLKTNTNFSDDNQLFQASSSMNTDGMINNNILGGFNINSTELKSNIIKYDQLTKRPREFYGNSANIGTFQEAIQMELNSTTPYTFTYPNNSTILTNRNTLVFPDGSSFPKTNLIEILNNMISQEEARLTNFYEFERLKVPAHELLRSQITGYEFIPKSNTDNYWKDLNLAKQYYYYARNQIPFQLGNEIYAAWDHNSLSKFTGIIYNLLMKNRNNIVFSDMDSKYVAFFLINNMKFNINETESEILLINNYLNTLSNMVKNYWPGQGNSIHTIIMNYNTIELPKLIEKYERKYNDTDYFYNIDNEYKLSYNSGANIGTFSLEIDYLNNYFLINSKDEGYLSFIPEPQSLKRFLNLQEQITEFEDGINLSNAKIVRIMNSKNISLKTSGSTIKNGLAFIKDKSYALRFDYNKLPRSNKLNKNPFMFKTKVGVRVCYLNIDSNNNIKLTTGEGVLIKLQIVKCPSAPEPSHIYEPCNTVGGYPRLSYYLPDDKGEYRFIDTSLLTKRYDLHDLPAHTMLSMPIEQQDKLTAQAFWNKLCEEGIIALPFPFPKDSPEYEAEGIRLCGIDKWNKRIKNKLAELAEKLANTKSTISTNQRAFYEKQSIILQRHQDNVNKIKADFQTAMEKLVADSRKDIDARMKSLNDDFEAKKISNQELKNRLDEMYNKALSDFETKKKQHELTVVNLIEENKKKIEEYVEILANIKMSSTSGFSNGDELENGTDVDVVKFEEINRKLDILINQIDVDSKKRNFYLMILVLVLLFIVYHAYNKYSNIKQLLLNLLANFMVAI